LEKSQEVIEQCCESLEMIEIASLCKRSAFKQILQDFEAAAVRHESSLGLRMRGDQKATQKISSKKEVK
jgi:hypothetical protein